MAGDQAQAQEVPRGRHRDRDGKAAEWDPQGPGRARRVRVELQVGAAGARVGGRRGGGVGHWGCPAPRSGCRPGGSGTGNRSCRWGPRTPPEPAVSVRDAGCERCSRGPPGGLQRKAQTLEPLGLVPNLALPPTCCATPSKSLVLSEAVCSSVKWG